MCGFVRMFVRVVEGLDLQELFAQGRNGDGEVAGWRWAMGEGVRKERVVVRYIW